MHIKLKNMKSYTHKVLEENGYKMGKEIVDDNHGVVCKLFDEYGFITNANYPYNKALFFLKIHAYPEVKVGDRVSFEKYTSYKGDAAKNVKRCD